jgi:hypothetical protein
MMSTDNSDDGIIQSHQNDAPSKVILMIYHQFPGIELVSPTYVGDITACYLSPDRRIDVGSTMQASFSINLDQEKSISALMYKLQVKNIGQSNEEIIFSEEATCIQLAIIWGAKSTKEFFAASYLLRHDENCVWNRDKLMSLADWYNLLSTQHGSIEDRWLMHDDIVLMIRVNTTRERGYYKIEMTMSEEGINKDTRRLLCFDMDRYVSMMVLVTTFTIHANVYY